MRISLISLAAAGALALGGCAYEGYGYGPGYGGYYGGYGGYGGYGWGAPYSGYDYGYYDPFGWYGDFYYPGVGIYVYDHHHNRHVWNNDQQRYWTGRRTQWQSRTGRSSSDENWSRYNHHRGDPRSH